MRIRSLLLAIVAMPGLALAQDSLPGLYFSHGDWELACDNTGTCRAAGYQPDGQGAPVSVLLTRKAGPGQPVRAEVQLGESSANTASVLTLALRIDARQAGALRMRMSEGLGELSPKMTAALLAALPRNADIEWSAGAQRWQLSDKGAAAVLLKMDEFQGRIGTRGALLKPGTASEARVLKASAAPVIKAVRWARPVPGKVLLAEHQAEPLRRALRATLGERDYCPELLDGDEEPLSVLRLDARRLLVSTRCATGAYNISDGYWVIDDSAPFHPVLVTTSGSETDEPNIIENHKARGIGDCRSSATWTWDGARFVQSAAASTGMCKMVAAGGAWELPRVVSEVR
jgi:hypothetical protein